MKSKGEFGNNLALLETQQGIEMPAGPLPIDRLGEYPKLADHRSGAGVSRGLKRPRHAACRCELAIPNTAGGGL